MKRCSALVGAVIWLPLIVPTTVAWADEPALKWEETIRQFEQQDQSNPPQPGSVLFVGSSSIRQWDTATLFAELPTINRGFGGSQISDVNYYLDRIVSKYQPNVIVFYSGDNDIASQKTARQVADDFDRFLNSVAAQLPKTQVLYLPIKPSLKRWSLWSTMRQANSLIRARMLTRHNWHYVDTATPMLDADGKPRAELFVEDGLHLNAKGYELWTSILKPRIERARQAATLPLARGSAFRDDNHNQRLDPGEVTMAGIRVSNGQEVVVTGSDGRYELPVDDDDIVFVVKPAGYRTPLSDDMLPRFYYIHKPNGSPDLKYPGVSPTGPLPDSIDFPLYPQREPDKFQAILFGDPQPRDQRELEYNTHDVFEELVGTKASFGVTLGDIVFDDLSLFEPQNRAIALLGIPWYNVIGNHDINYDAKHDGHSDETFERVYGPPYYSFDYGLVHFIVLDDIQWFVEREGREGRYRGGLGAEQMEFIRNDLAAIDENQMVVLMMHIPLVDVRDRHELYRLIERRPFCMSISGHTHHHEHRYITRDDGWQGAQPHHHVINVTVCGSWWSGAPDERGLPHTMMADGAPNGYSVITFDGNDYRIDFKAAGRSADYQMNIHAPEQIVADEVPQTTIYVNVFNGSERSKVEIRVGQQGPWTALERSVQVDPGFAQIVAKEKAIPDRQWRDLPQPKPSPHLWRGPLPGKVEPGVHLIQVRATDEHGRVVQGNRIVRIVAAAAPQQ